MNLPRPFHLPTPQDAAVWCRAWRPLGATSLQVPVLDPPGVAAVWQQLDAAATTWRSFALPKRVDLLAQAMGTLCARGAGNWRAALGRSAALSPAGVDAAWEATFAPHDGQSLRAALAQEGLDAACCTKLGQEGRLPLRLVHVVAGNVLAPTLTTLLRGWLLGAAQWLRPAEREPLFAVCLLEELSTLLPAVAACTAVLWWPHAGEAMETAVLDAADAVTVQGSDPAVAALQDKVLALQRPPRLIAYGARWSGALVASAAQTAATAAGLAVDVALFDQQGCLSPTLVFAEQNPGLADWCATLARALQVQEERLPRGPVTATANAALRHWHESVRVDVALGAVQGFWEDSTRWGVVLLRRCASYATPLDRHVIVVPFTDAAEIVTALGEALQRLQGLVVALDGWDASRCQAALQALQPSRTAAPGELQRAPLAWPQDHRMPFGSLLAPGTGDCAAADPNVR